MLLFRNLQKLKSLTFAIKCTHTCLNLIHVWLLFADDNFFASETYCISMVELNTTNLCRNICHIIDYTLKYSKLRANEEGDRTRV